MQISDTKNTTLNISSLIEHKFHQMNVFHNQMTASKI